MKNLLLTILIAPMLLFNAASAQCPYDNTIYLQGAAPTVVGNSVLAPQTWGGDFNRVTGMQAGYTYEVSTCGTPTFDSELTIYPAGGGSPVAYDDDGCGSVGGPSKITFTPTVTGDYDMLLDQYNCLSNQIDMDMLITLVSTGGGGGNVLHIPVVVHVVYKNASENISDAQIQSQIDALNRDYRKLNTDFANLPTVFQPLGADMLIEFCPGVDPNGNPTTGITRTSTTTPSFSQTVEVKFSANGGIENWNPQNYLNMWVCDLSGSLLGYATFPDQLTTSPQLDGVVIDYQYFGTFNATPPFDLGRTATHEVGHWLNLRHIWGDSFCGDDFVSDTPTQEQANGGCPTFPHVTCGNGPNGDLFYDYMDYSNDACLLLFTNGQKTRVDASISAYRTGLATSQGCGATSGINDVQKQQFKVYPNPASSEINLLFGHSGQFTLMLTDIAGKMVWSENVTAEKVTINTSDFKNGIYFLRASTSNSTEVIKISVVH